jgi:hypothetical protein
MSDKYEQLIEENTQLKKALISSKSLIDRITSILYYSKYI